MTRGKSRQRLCVHTRVHGVFSSGISQTIKYRKIAITSLELITMLWNFNLFYSLLHYFVRNMLAIKLLRTTIFRRILLYSVF